MIYDIHLIGDLEPDNKLLEDVLELGEIVKNFNKDCETLFINKPEYSELIAKKLEEAMKSELPYQEKAQLVMSELYKLRLGSMLHQTWGKTLKFKYSADANVNDRAAVTPRPVTTNAVVEAKAVKETDAKLYRVTASGKIHNSGCEYYSAKGELTAEPKGENCKKCGGFK
jgi:predicted house-cleaning noncanonical NTP pyrophosphatase (MazG superfamily)